MARKTWLSVVMLGLLAAACTPGAYIDTGERFGVRVGMPLADAHAIWVQRGMEPSSPQVNAMMQECGNRKRGPGDQIEYFSGSRSSWRAGRTYCLLAVDGRVTLIAWGDAYL